MLLLLGIVAVLIFGVIFGLLVVDCVFWNVAWTEKKLIYLVI
jgi:hypothetical protein